MADIITPYVNQDLFLTREFDRNFSESLVARSSDGPEPFPRKADLWWFALTVGARIGIRTPLPSVEQLTKFNTGAIFSQEPWRIVCLELIALAEHGESVVEKPSEVIRIGHEFALTGLGWLEEKLAVTTAPTVKLMTEVKELLGTQEPC